jgi:hypothetical protein
LFLGICAYSKNLLKGGNVMQQNNKLVINRKDLIKEIACISNKQISEEVVTQIKKSEMCDLSKREAEKLLNRLLNSKLAVSIVENVYSNTESKIRETLSKANSEQDVTIRLFDGISLDSKFVPETQKINNLTGEMVVRTGRIKPKANISRRYAEKLNNYYK